MSFNGLQLKEILFSEIDQNIQTKGFYVYKGLSKKGQLLYIGTTIQIPQHRFNYHKTHDKHFIFKVIKECKTSEEMLEIEFALIKHYRPKFNKISQRIQNFNIQLTNEQLEKRIGDKEWCQVCLKRRVNQGYSSCYFCSKIK